MRQVTATLLGGTPLLLDRDPGGTDDALLEPVPRLVDLRADRTSIGCGFFPLGNFTLCVSQRLVLRRIERLPHHAELFEPELRNDCLNGLCDGLERSFEVIVCACECDVVEDRHEFRQHRDDRHLTDCFAITIDSLAVVGVFRRNPLQVDREFRNPNVIRCNRFGRCINNRFSLR